MSDRTSMDATLGRIQKLLRLARDGGATEAEADTAMTLAQRLMEEHNLTMATVDATGGAATEGGTRAKGASAGRAMYAWQRNLMEQIAEVNFCHMEVLEKSVRSGTNDWGDERTRRTPSGYELIGREANVAAATSMFDYLCQTINRLVLDYVGGDNRQRMTKAGVAFQEGAGDRLRERIKERHATWLAEQAREAREEQARRRHPAATSTSNALVVVMEDYAQAERDLNTDFRLGREPGTTARQRAEAEAQYQAAIEKSKQAREAAKADLLAAGCPEEAAEWMAWRIAQGYSPERAHEMWELRLAEQAAEQAKERRRQAYLDRLSPEERERREKAEEDRKRRDNEKWWDSYNRRNAKRDPRAYRHGQEAGEAVGLDPQVTRTRRAALGGK